MQEVTLEQHPFQSSAERAAGRAPAAPLQQLRTLGLRQTAAGGCVLAGLIALLLGWWGVAGTPQEWKQLSYLASGGLVGGSLIVIGVTLFISFEHARDRAAIAELTERDAAMDEKVERLLAVELPALTARLDELHGQLVALGVEGPNGWKPARSGDPAARRRRPQEGRR